MLMHHWSFLCFSLTLHMLTHTLTHALSLVAVMKPKELKTKISHANSLTHSLPRCLSISLSVSLSIPLSDRIDELSVSSSIGFSLAACAVQLATPHPSSSRETRRHLLDSIAYRNSKTLSKTGWQKNNPGWRRTARWLMNECGNLKQNSFIYLFTLWVSIVSF